jgi:hypothetical protein
MSNLHQTMDNKPQWSHIEPPTFIDLQRLTGLIALKNNIFVKPNIFIWFYPGSPSARLCAANWGSSSIIIRISPTSERCHQNEYHAVSLPVLPLIRLCLAASHEPHWRRNKMFILSSKAEPLLNTVYRINSHLKESPTHLRYKDQLVNIFRKIFCFAVYS